MIPRSAPHASKIVTLGSGGITRHETGGYRSGTSIFADHLDSCIMHKDTMLEDVIDLFDFDPLISIFILMIALTLSSRTRANIQDHRSGGLSSNSPDR